MICGAIAHRLQSFSVRAAVSLVLLLVAGVALGQTIEFQNRDDGGITLWLDGAPSVIARDNGGWTLEPTSVKENATWKRRLATMPEEARSWPKLLDLIHKNEPVKNVREVKVVVHLSLLTAPDVVTIKASKGAGPLVSAEFSRKGQEWTSTGSEQLTKWVVANSGIDQVTVESLLRRSDQTLDPWSAFLNRTKKDESLRAIGKGKAIAIEVRKAPPPPPKDKKKPAEESTLGAWIGIGAAALVVVVLCGLWFVPTIRSRILSLAAKPTSKGTTDGPDANLVKRIDLLISAAGSHMSAERKKGIEQLRIAIHTELNSRPAIWMGRFASGTSATNDDDLQLAETLRREHLEQLNASLTKLRDPCSWLDALVQDHSKQKSLLDEERRKNLELDKSLKTTIENAQRYKDEHGEWLRDRDSLRDRLTASEANFTRERDAKNKLQSELTATRTRADDLSRAAETRAQKEARLSSRKASILALVDMLRDVLPLIHSEVNRVDVSAPIAYLFTYSATSLLDALTRENKSLEAAMLANIDTVASNVSEMPQCARLAATARSLREGLPSVETSAKMSPLAHQLGALLRYLKDQRRLQIRFFAGVDEDGRAYEVAV